MIIGLTGGIASGKSTVSELLNRLGATIIDADQVAREVVVPGTEAWKKIIQAFGTKVLKEQGQLNRKKIGDIVFSNEKLLDKLNSITHPEIKKLIQTRTKELKESGAKVIIVDAPLLIEAGMLSMVDELWVVYVNRATQIKRLMERDGISEENALAIIGSQMDIEEKRSLGDIIIDNSYTLEETNMQIKRLWDDLLHRI